MPLRLIPDLPSVPHGHRRYYVRVGNRKTPVVLLYENLKDIDLNQFQDNDSRKRAAGFLERLKENDITYEAHKFSQDSTWELHNVFASMCHSCRGWTLWVKDEIVYPINSAEIIAHEDMPAPIRDDFNEAAQIVNISPRGAAALARLCIQKLMPLLGEKGDNLTMISPRL